MKKLKYLIFTIMLFLICISNTYAACTQEEIDNFKKVEDKYIAKYEFNKTTKTYDVKFYYSKTSLYSYIIPVELNNGDMPEITEDSINVKGVKPGTYVVEIKGISGNCNDVVKKIELKLSEYNVYSEDPLCKGIEEFVLCKSTYNKEIDYETFVSRVNTYKKTKNNQTNPTTKQEKSENESVEYLKNHLIEIIIIIVFLILLISTLYITVNSIRKSRRLE